MPPERNGAKGSGFPLRRAEQPATPAPADAKPAPATPAPAPASAFARAWLRAKPEPEPEPEFDKGFDPAPAPWPRPKGRTHATARDDAPLELTSVMPPRTDAASPPPPPPPRYPVFTGGFADAVPEGAYTTNLPVTYSRWAWVWRWGIRGAGAFIVFVVMAIAWLALTAPLSKSLEPPAPPSITLLSSEGTPIARRGAVIGDPVDASKLPGHVRGAFVAIEDRRFYSHWGVDPRGMLRALVHNMTGDGGTQGGSTITQQLAKNAFLDSSRTATRKFQEALISFWLEAWLSKDEILSRYLSNVYFGDNVYGLSAAARHYFSVAPEDLTVSQASMLAGLVQAPSRLAPTGNLKGARDRQKLVIGAMADVGLLTKKEAKAVRPAVLHPDKVKQLPNGTYFADWVLPQARDRAGGVATEQTVRTTLETNAQKAAERAVRNAGLNKAQVAIVAMRPDGRVVAMVGGRSYGESPFNRATQARRQPGSAFKLFVYMAALRSGMTPETMVDDTPVTIGNWSPQNSHESYEGKITLARAFAKSSNVVAARLTQKLGVSRVARTARDLGISTPIGNDASIALGTSTVSLLELTSAYAAIAEGAYPVRPRGLAEEAADQDWLGARLGGSARISRGQLEDMRTLLEGVVQSGTGRAARLSIPTFGKTGTTQDNRDALFIGYAGGLVAGVWLGNDDNSPNAGLSGSGLPARIWRDFMTRALDLRAPPPAEPIERNETDGDENFSIEDTLQGLGIRFDEGTMSVEIDTPPIDDIPPPPQFRDDADIVPRRYRGDEAPDPERRRRDDADAPREFRNR